ncbi:hypothetical protein M885DRAFT_115023 [Pelagophyceae sp. CCMP2097]|nr:hypothetical protein M885DRAFT_115023 [Pelagophyceae sp. CCMP2097]
MAVSDQAPPRMRSRPPASPAAGDSDAEETDAETETVHESDASDLFLSLRRCEKELRAAVPILPSEARESIRHTIDELARLSSVAQRLDRRNDVVRAARRRAAEARRRTTMLIGAGLRRLPARRERVYSAVLNDERRPAGTAAGAQSTLSWSALHPNSDFKRRWDFATSVFALVFVLGRDARAYLGPVVAALRPGAQLPAFIPGPNATVNSLLNAWFAVDVGLNFVTGYVDRDGVLIMSKRRIALHYLSTYFLLDIWCALPVERYMLPPPRPPLPFECAAGSSETALLECIKRRGPLNRLRNIARHVRVIVPKSLAFAKRHGRLRQVLVSAPGLTTAAIRLGRFLRTTRLLSVKWRSFAVLFRRSAMTAKLRSRALFSPGSREERRREALLEEKRNAAEADGAPKPITRACSEPFEVDVNKELDFEDVKRLDHRMRARLLRRIRGGFTFRRRQHGSVSE